MSENCQACAVTMEQLRRQDAATIRARQDAMREANSAATVRVMLEAMTERAERAESERDALRAERDALHQRAEKSEAERDFATRQFAGWRLTVAALKSERDALKSELGSMKARTDTAERKLSDLVATVTSKGFGCRIERCSNGCEEIFNDRADLAEGALAVLRSGVKEALARSGWPQPGPEVEP